MPLNAQWTAHQLRVVVRMLALTTNSAMYAAAAQALHITYILVAVVSQLSRSLCLNFPSTHACCYFLVLDSSSCS